MFDPPSERDRRLGDLLVRLGLADGSEIAAAGGLDAALARLSVLSPSELRRRMAATPAPDPKPPSIDCDTVLAAPSSAADPPTRAHSRPTLPRADLPPGAPAGFGRYVLLECLGVGGMGVVWKAWDPELGRVVALKQVRKTDDFGPEHVARFQREARLAAKLHHPNIVAIHDVGAAGDDQYLTMEYIEGGTFAHFLERAREAKRAGRREGHARLRDEVRLLAEIAAAVAYAHREGVVHRDLKPGNVLLDRAEKPYVMDFGLAKDVDAAPGSELAMSFPTLTMAGQVVGTPDYMSPEQAESDGGRIGPRSDVWALGVILFEILTGRLPYSGERSMRTLMKVIHAEAPRPRGLHPFAPADLEAVCLKALEKDPERRYESADAFAEELRRWLRGEPVKARRHGPAYRAWRWALRRKAVVAAAVAALALAAWAGASTLAAWSARERLLAGLRRATGLSVQGALSARRMGLLGAMETHRPALDAAFRDADAALGGSSPEPAYSMGRFARAVMDEPGALEWQRRALAADPEYAPALYETAVLEARAYGERRVRVRDAVRAERGAGLFAAGAAGPARAAEPAEPGRADLEAHDPELRAHKDRLIACLGTLERLAAGGRAAAEGVGPAALACVEGLLAAHSGADSTAAWPDAQKHFEAAIATDPQLEEAYEGLFEAAGACGRWTEAIDACTRGIARDRGYLPHRLNRAAILATAGAEEMMHGADAGARFTSAAEDYGFVIEQKPEDARAWSGRANARLDLGVFEELSGRPREAPFEEATRDFEKAIALDPKDPAAYVGRGNARLNLSRLREERGGDAAEYLAAAIADYDAALALDARLVEAWKDRGMARMAQADAAARKGVDPGVMYGHALEDFAKALELHAGDAGAWKFRAMAWRNWGAVKRSRGEDADATFASAEEDMGRALKLDPHDAEAWQALGKTRMNRADGVRSSGGDPVPGYRSAAEACARAVEENPKYVDGWLSLGNVHLNWGGHRTSRGEDPAETYAAAAAAFDKALALHATDPSAWRSLAMLRMNWGAWRLMKGEDPGDQFRAGEEATAKALALNPENPEAYVARATMRVNWAMWEEKQGLEPDGRYGAAVADLDAALARNPAYAEAWLTRGRARMRWGTAQGRRGIDPRPLFEAAATDLDEFLKRVPGQKQATAMREQLRTWFAQVGGAAGPAYVRAIAAADEALRAGRTAEARRGYEEAFAAAPADASKLAGAERDALMGAHYNYACLLAQAAPAADAAEASRLRDGAFDHLARAVELGWKDAGQTRGDPDLAPLRDDARWEKLMESMR